MGVSGVTLDVVPERFSVHTCKEQEDALVMSRLSLGEAAGNLSCSQAHPHSGLCAGLSLRSILHKEGTHAHTDVGDLGIYRTALIFQNTQVFILAQDLLYKYKALPVK